MHCLESQIRNWVVLDDILNSGSEFLVLMINVIFTIGVAVGLGFSKDWQGTLFEGDCSTSRAL
jgi:hypothetical protein